MIRAGIIVSLALVVFACTKDSLEKSFYARPRPEWPVKLRSLPLEQQWNVYLYGVKTRKPPPFELSIELAKHRSDILPNVIRTTLVSREKTDLESVSTVLQMMREVVHFNPCIYRPYRETRFQRSLIAKLDDGTKFACM
jgi:hypothetical protein